jgi:L-fuconolactonase
MLGWRTGTLRIAGVVGWADPTQPPDRIAARLDTLRRNPKLIGIRHLSQFEPDDDWLLRPDVIAGLGSPGRKGMPCDLLVNPVQLTRAPAVRTSALTWRSVIDHLASRTSSAARSNLARPAGGGGKSPMWCKLSAIMPRPTGRPGNPTISSPMWKSLEASAPGV